MVGPIVITLLASLAHRCIAKMSKTINYELKRKNEFGLSPLRESKQMTWTHDIQMHTWDQLRLQYSGPTFRTNKRLSFSCQASHISTLKKSYKKWTLMHMVNCLMHSAVQKAEKAIFLWLIFDLSFSCSKKKLRQGYGSMDPLSDVDHITRGHLSEKT